MNRGSVSIEKRFAVQSGARLFPSRFFNLATFDFLFSARNGLLRDQLVDTAVPRLDAIGWSTVQRLSQRLPRRLQPKTFGSHARSSSDPLLELEPVRQLIQVLQSLPGFTPDLLLKRLPRVLNEPDARRMGLQVAQGLAERGVVRLVKVAAGVPA